MIRFIHTSDWQIGMTRHFLEGEAQARFTQDRIDAIVTLGRLASEHDARFLVVAGDLFEANQLSSQTVMRTLEAMAEIRLPVFVLPGNHDPLDAASLFRSAAFTQTPDNIHVLDDMNPRRVPGLEGVEVVGAPWHNKRPSEDLVAGLARALPPMEQGVRIAVAHGQVDTLTPERRPDTIDLAQAERAFDEGRWHYLALGDRHSVTEVGTTGAAWYSGAPEATDFREVRPGHALLVEIEPCSPCRVRELAVGQWRFIRRQWHTNGSDDIEAFERWLSEIEDKPRCILKLGFEGSLNLADYARLESVIESYRERFASLRPDPRNTDLSVLPDALDEDAVALTGYARDTWAELVAAAGDPDDAAARDALALFYRLASGQQSS